MQNKPNRRLLVVGCLLGLCAILTPIVGGVAYFFFPKDNPQLVVQNEATSSPSLAFITITAPAAQSHYPVNSSIPVRVEVKSSEPVTQLEFFVNSNRVEIPAITPVNPKSYRAAWDFIPSAEGEQTLMVKARNQSGQTFFSNLVRFETTAPRGAGIQIQAKEGETVEAIAAAYGVAPEDVQVGAWDEATQTWAVGPGSDGPVNESAPVSAGTEGGSAPVDISAPLKPGQTIIVPLIPRGNLPGVINPPGAGNGQENNNDPANLPGVQENEASLAGAPSEPELSVTVGDKDCAVTLSFTDPSEASDYAGKKVEEKGFYVYKMPENKTYFEKFTSLPPVTGPEAQTVLDENLTGSTTYAVSAYNAKGESFSDPVTVPSSATCGAQTGENGLSVSNYKLNIPSGFDLAYVYASRDQGPWQRVPKSINEFFETSDQADLAMIVDALPNGPTPPAEGKMQIAMDVWGWQGGTIVFIGRMTAVLPSVYPTEVGVCNHPGSPCREGLGWSDTLVVPEKQANSDDDWDFYWETKDSAGKVGVWQISNMPFPNNSALVKDAITGTSKDSDFSLEPLELKSKYFLPLRNGDVYYLRVIPMIDNQVAGEPSKQIKIEIREIEPVQVEIFKYPQLFSVEILEFKPLHWPEPGVCHGRVVVEEDYHLVLGVEDDPLNPADAASFDTEDRLIPKGTLLCPDIYRGEGKSVWEEFWEGVTASLSFVSETWEGIKQGVVDAVGSVVCGGNETCKDGLMMALNAGLMALGIPPSIPNFDQLLDQGIGMLAAEVAGQLTNTEFAKDIVDTAIKQGLVESKEEVDAWLAEQLAAGLKTAYNEMMKEKENPACEDEEAAHRKGVEPICWPGLKTRLDEAGQHVPASVKLKITRSATEGTTVSPEMVNQYQINVSFSAITDYPRDIIAANGQTIPVDGPLQGQLFNTKIITAPMLQPGQSEVVEIPLFPTDYWAPGHKEALNGWQISQCSDSGCITLSTNDWWKLYYNSNVSISAYVSVMWGSEMNCPVGSSGVPSCTFVTDSCQAGPMPISTDPFTTFCTK